MGVLPMEIAGVLPHEIALPILICNSHIVMSEVDAAWAIITAVAQSTDAGAGLLGGPDASVAVGEWDYRWHLGMGVVSPHP